MTSSQQMFQGIQSTLDEYSKTFGVSKEVAAKEMMEFGLHGGAAASILGVKAGVQGSLQDGVSKIDADNIAKRVSYGESFVAMLQNTSQLSE
ncbi:MAG: hypothetical protein HYZ47_03500 [Simkania negevensis]|nr:hypothetical protein [Simkania negevensis]